MRREGKIRGICRDTVFPSLLRLYILGSCLSWGVCAPSSRLWLGRSMESCTWDREGERHLLMLRYGTWYRCQILGQKKEGWSPASLVSIQFGESDRAEGSGCREYAVIGEMRDSSQSQDVPGWLPAPGNLGSCEFSTSEVQRVTCCLSKERLTLCKWCEVFV